MSDPNAPDPYDRTRRLRVDGTERPEDTTGPQGGSAASPVDPTRRLGQGGRDAASPADRTRPLGSVDPADRPGVMPPGRGERTQVMPGGVVHEQPIAYTEDYSDQDPSGIGTPHRGPNRPRQRADVEDEGRTFTPTTLALSVIAALLVGAILTLLLLPEEEPQVVLADQQAQTALLDAQTQNAEQATRIAELEAQIAELQGQVAQRDQTIAEQQQALAEGGEAAAADQEAANQAAAEREAALTAREAALAEREAAMNQRQTSLDEREAQVAAREEAVASAEQNPGTGGGGFELPEVGDLEIPVEVPQIDEEQARGIIERFVDRLSSFVQ